ncbi:MAG: ComEC/Rec2 family competence protein [Myxococcota bacterium]
MAILFVLFQSAGILWADSGGRVAAAWALLAFLLGLDLIRLLWASSPHNALRPERAFRSARFRGEAWILLALLAFFLGHVSHSGPLEHARRDAAAIAALDRGAEVYVDAKVASRKAGAYGDRVRLEALRRVDTGERLVTGAELRLGRRDAGAGVPPSRAEQLLWPGAEVRLGLRLSRILGTRNPGSADWEAEHKRTGLAVHARLVDPDWVIERVSDVRGRRSPRAELEQRRRAWQSNRGAALGGDERIGQALARALVLGERTTLSPASKAAFRETGLGHLLAVSGLHVGFVAGGAAWGARGVALFFGAVASRFRGRRKGVARPFAGPIWVGLSVAVGYAWMTGSAISVARAGLLLGLFVLAREGGRWIPPLSALSCVAIGLLWMNPAALFDLGARFSFSACFALAVSGLWQASGADDADDEDEGALADPGESLAGPLARAARGSLMASLAVSFGTLPWVAQIGGDLHGLSPLYNLLAIPWTGLFVLPASMFSVLGAGVIPESIVEGLLGPAAMLERAVVWAAAHSPPLSPMLGLSPLIAGGCGLLGLAVVRRGALLTAFVFWGGISLAGVASSVDPEFRLDRPRAIFFDVGQGDAALVQAERTNWLVDTGPGRDDGSGGGALLAALAALDVQHLNVLVITHADLDHRAGSKRVLETLAVDALWLPESGRSEASLQALVKIATRRGTRVRFVSVGSVPIFSDPSLQVEVLWPPRAGGKLSRNESSLVLRFGTPEASLLMMADVGHATERVLLGRSESLQSDFLKVGHHGSRGSTGEAFLESVSPRWAILSAPCEATRGLPTQLVIDRLRKSGAELLWTGRDGAIAVALQANADEAAGDARGSSGSSGLSGAGGFEREVRTWAPSRICLNPT